jgi:hypothetical protein
VSVHDLTQTASRSTPAKRSRPPASCPLVPSTAYQITDDGNYAIVIRGFSDQDLLLSLKNKPVRVTGRFGYDPENGVYIEASAVIEIVEQQP